MKALVINGARFARADSMTFEVQKLGQLPGVGVWSNITNNRADRHGHRT